MLATTLKSPIATHATLLIVETFAKVRELKQELVDMQTAMQNASATPQEQKNMMHRFGETLSDIVMPDLQTYEAEAALENPTAPTGLNNPTTTQLNSQRESKTIN